MRKFTYLVPKTLNEAISMHVSYDGRTRYIAGGTDVLVAQHPENLAKAGQRLLQRLADHVEGAVAAANAGRGGLIVNLPGKPAAIRECLLAVMPLYWASRQRMLFAICALEVAVIVLAASGLVGGGH